MGLICLDDESGDKISAFECLSNVCIYILPLWGTLGHHINF